MIYFFTMIFVGWLFAYIFIIRGRSGPNPMDSMRDAQAEMREASEGENKRAAARKFLEIIEDYDLSGIVAEDAKKEAEDTLKWYKHV